MIRNIALVFATTCLAAGLTAAGQEFEGLGNLPGSLISSRAKAVSADGSVVVGSSFSASGREAFRWTQEAGMVGLGDLPGGEFYSEAYGVSSDGSVIVGYSHSASGREAFRWTQAGGMVGLGDLPWGEFYSWAYGVSADGSVVVGVSHGWPTGWQAFRWTQGGGMVGLGDLPGGGYYSEAYGVSADGLVVVGGGNVVLPDGSGARQAFRWTQEGGMVSLVDLPGGGFYSEAYGVSADGSVIVGSSRIGSIWGDREAFRWTQEAGMVSLVDLPGGGFYREAYGVSADGLVIVGYSNSASFYWTEEAGMVSLQDLLVHDYGLDLTGWTLVEARGVSADGFTIVGSGGDPDGKLEAWLAHIPPRIQLVDYNNPAFRECDAGLPARLATQGEEVEGLAADGVTPVLIRIDGFSGPFEFEIEVHDENGSTDAASVGTLRHVCSDETANPLTIESVFIEQEGRSFAFAILEAPPDFARDEDDFARAERPLTIELRRTTDEVLQTLETKLVRPPVVLVHGIWGSPGSWNWGLFGDARFFVERYDYSSTNADAFAVNLYRMRLATNRSKVLMRADRDIAVTQVDLFGHSMGGLLARLYARNRTGEYLRPDNFEKGDLHKLITVNTPHFGSKLAPFLVTAGNIPTPLGFAMEVVKSIGVLFGGDPACVSCGGVRDLRPDSAQLCSLQAVQIPAHAMYSGDPDLARVAALNTLTLFFPLVHRPLSAIFGEDHDTIVGVTSQRGGLGGTNVSVFTGEFHEAAAGRSDYSDRAVQLLNASVIDASVFAPDFPAHQGECARGSRQTKDNSTGDWSVAVMGGGLVISAPAAGTIVTPGETVTVALEGQGFVPERVLVVMSGDAVVVEDPPWVAVLQVPMEAIGTVVIRAFAVDTSDALAQAESTVDVEVNAMLTSISVIPDPIVLTTYSQEVRTSIFGVFDDGITRNISNGTVPTVFGVDDVAVAEVSVDGHVAGRQVGETTLRVSSGSIDASPVRVVVASLQFDVDRDGDVDLRDFSSLQQCFSGADPGMSPSLECRDFFDSDGDLDVDLRDYVGFRGAFLP